MTEPIIKRIVNIPTEMWLNVINGCTQRVSWDDLIKVIRDSESTDKIKVEIQSAIDEIREKEKYHASCIKENNKFVIMGLEIALDIIKRNENDRNDKRRRYCAY